MLRKLTDRLDALYHGHEDRYRASVLWMVLGITAVGDLLYPLSLLVTFGELTSAQQVAILVGGVGVLLSVAASAWFLWRGHCHLATWLFLGGQWLGIVLLTLLLGVAGSWMVAVPVIVMLGGVLLAWQGAIAFAALCVVGLVGVGLLQIYGIPPTPPAATNAILMHMTAMIGVTLAAGGVAAVFARQPWDMVATAQRSAGRLEMMLEVSRALSSTSDLDGMLGAVVACIHKRLDLYHVQIFLLDEDMHELQLKASSTPIAQQLLRRLDRPLVGSQSVIGQAALGKPIVIHDIKSHPLFRPDKFLPDTRAEAALPLLVGERLIGVLDVHSTSPDVFSQEGVGTLQALTSQIASAVETARPVTPEVAALKVIEPALQATDEIAATADPDEIVATLRRHVLGAFDRVALVSLQASPEGIAPKTLSVWDRDGVALEGEPPEGLHQAVGEGAEGPLIVPDVARLEDGWKEHREYLRDHLLLGSVAIFPLVGQGRIVGYLWVGTRQPHVYTDYERCILRLLSGQVASVLENLSLVDALGHQAERLGLLNKLVQSIAGAHDLDELYAILDTHLADVLDYQYLSLALRDEEKPDVRLLRLRSPGAKPVGADTLMPAGTVIEQALRERKTITADDVLDLPDGDLWLREGARTLVVVPVAVYGEPLGTLNVGRAATGSFDVGEVALLEQVAAQFAAAIENTRLLDQTQDVIENVGLLLFVSRRMFSASDRRGIYDVLLEVFSAEAMVDRIVVWRAVPEPVYPPEYTEVVAIWNRADELDARGEQLGETCVGSHFLLDEGNQRAAETVIIENIEADSRLAEEVRTSLQEMGMRSLIRLPIVRNQYWFGEVLLESCSQQRFTSTEAQLYRAIVDQTAVALENAFLVERLTGSLQEATTLYTASLSVSATQSIDEIVEIALSQTVSINNAMRGYLYLAGLDLHQQPGQVYLAAWWEDNEIRWPDRRVYTALESVPVLGQLPASDEDYIFDDASGDEQLDEAVRQACLARGVEAIAVIPLRVGDIWLGALVLESMDANGFEEDRIRLCRGIADVSALALNLQMTLRGARRSATREQTLREITERIRSASDVETVLQVAVEELSRALGVEEGAARIRGGSVGGGR